MTVLRPQNLDDALRHMCEGSSVVPIAGGTDLMTCWHARSHEALSMLDLSSVRELAGVRLTPTHLELGALATYWDVITSNDIAQAFPLLAQAARVVGATQIQTRGTWVGNIANGSPAADGVLALMACDATVELAAANHERVYVPLDRFYTGYRQSVRRPEQLIVSIRVPRRRREVEWFFKVGARAAQAITKVGVAMAKDETGWRVVASSVAPTIRRCHALENALNAGRTMNSVEDVRDLLRVDISPIDDIRSTAEYRQTVLSRLIYYWLLEQA